MTVSALLKNKDQKIITISRTKITTVLGILFFVVSLGLAYLSKVESDGSSILTDVNGEAVVSVPVSDAEKAAAQKGLSDLLNQTKSDEPAVPVSQ